MGAVELGGSFPKLASLSGKHTVAFAPCYSSPEDAPCSLTTNRVVTLKEGNL
ncbi:hypothetical protein KIN20_036088 [Parelaphostrongylus tenuis]|uniref:Uncharacterized protein n=1 Tax=Parelaphostrongylus tenuis TaxID=148309 RepID=A0AAD5WL16_PARTN|nr:hypothetical protein KIN20_036088 [Parelaphostrongylus tenuis]